jgi:HNH endonuclease/AP2 domain
VKQGTKAALSAATLRDILHYDPDTSVFRWKIAPCRSVKAGNIAGHLCKEGYRKIKIHDHTYFAHRLAWAWFTGGWPKEEIDHFNLDRADNRFRNLREATHSQNRGNTRAHSPNKSGLKGAHWRKDTRCWRAEIRFDRKTHSLGHFPTPEEANEAYRVAAQRHFGAFARWAP